MFKGISSAASSLLSVTGFEKATKAKDGSLLANEGGGGKSAENDFGSFSGSSVKPVEDIPYQEFEAKAKALSAATPKGSAPSHQVAAAAPSTSLKHGLYNRTGLRAPLAQSEIDARDATREADLNPELIKNAGTYTPPKEEEVLGKKTPASTPPTSRSTSPGSQVDDLISFDE